MPNSFSNSELINDWLEVFGVQLSDNCRIEHVDGWYIPQIGSSVVLIPQSNLKDAVEMLLLYEASEGFRSAMIGVQYAWENRYWFINEVKGPTRRADAAGTSALDPKAS